MMFKIGLNPQKTERFPCEYVVVRHPPASPSTFDFYVKRALGNFDALATWKPSAPHSIARITPRNAACNHCHGRRELFLRPADMQVWEQAANAAVIVGDEAVPAPVEAPAAAGSK
jgi:thiosulfate/3-mercaptopyruvate sulfurtransferase